MKIISLSFLLMLIGYTILGGYQYSKVRAESIQVIKEDIAFDLATAQILSAQKKIETLKKFGFYDLKITPESTDQDSRKLFSIKIPLVVDGTLVGYLVDVPRMSTLMQFVLGSTYLGILFFTLFVVVSVLIIIPLARYKKDVQSFIKSAKEKPLDDNSNGNLDEITSEIRDIINVNTNFAMKIHELDYEIKQKEAVAVLAKQVAHDIRSPLSVLNMLVPTLTTDANAEKCELLVHATQRIDKIAEDLLTKGRIDAPIVQLSSLDLEKLVLEKQMLLASQSQKTRIELKVEKSKFFKTRISKIDFERIISNLLNNSLESINNNQTGVVELDLSEIDNSTVLVIKDNGKGIPYEILSKIGTKGFSQGKTNGNGLGVYHAKSTIEQAGGVFNISSQLGIGTTITISI